MSDHRAPGEPTGLYPLVRLVAALLLSTLGGAPMYAIIVVLKPAAIEFGAGRGGGSVPYMLLMAAAGIGGAILGRLTDRHGVFVPILVGSVGLSMGFIAASYAVAFWQFYLALGVLAGLFGTSATFGPLAADITHWFSRRRGLAVSVVVTGTYLAGAIWPPIVQHSVDVRGWRETFFILGLVLICAMLPLALLLYRRPPGWLHGHGMRRSGVPPVSLGIGPNTLQCVLCTAGIGCCVAMAMPQVHIVAHVTDLGHAAQRGAEMLSLMLGFGIISRITSGWIADRIGGLRTLLLGSTLQMIVLGAFLTTDALTALYIISAAFGLSQGGITPSYAIVVRTFFPAGEAGWRIGLTMLFTFMGMALGGWLAGALYDLTGSYTASFINAIAFNVLNMAIVAALAQRERVRRLRALGAVGD